MTRPTTTTARQPVPSRTSAAHRSQRLAARRALARLAGSRRHRATGCRPGRLHPTLLVVTGVVALVLAACGSGVDEAAEDAAQAPGGGVHTTDDRGGFVDADEGEDAAEDDAGASAPITDDADEAVDETTGETTDPASDIDRGRRIIRTAYLELEAEDTALAADRIAAIAREAGGFVAETDLQRDRDGIVRGSITLRVPSAELFDTVEALDELAVAVPTRRIDERDVTAKSVDLEASRRNLVAYEQELTALLGDVRESSSRASDLLEVFERIRSVRAEIDRIDAQRSVLDDQVALATIEVWLQPASRALPVGDTSWSLQETVRDALSATARGLTAIADVAIRVVLTVLPIALLLALPLAIPALWWRRRRARRAGTPPPPPPAGPTAPDASDTPPGTGPAEPARTPSPSA